MKQLCFILGMLGLCAGAAVADTFDGVEFPQGAVSFADVVVGYDPAFGGGNVPTATYQDASQSLGAPNYGEGTDPAYVSLGAGGRIELRFTDNSLTGSGDSGLDLWIFEIGPDVEDTFVDISKDGATWFPVGKVFGATSGIDIDAYGFGPADFFSYVRLTDDLNEGQGTGPTVGADIDAVGAITSAPPVDNNPIPEPSSLLLLCSGLGLIGAMVRRRR